MIPSCKIRNIEINPGLVLAPMSGVTTSAFRRLIKELNPGAVGLMISEFVSVEGMTRGVKRTLAMMRYEEFERPFGIQIFGYDIKRMSDAAKMVQDAGADLVDVNCGCPAPKVVRRGGGCELMRQPDHLAQIFREIRKSVSIPLTMKMRSGWDSTSLNALEVAHIVESEGVEAITIHGRTRVQLYRGDADWSVTHQVAQAVSIPVFGSGDVVDQDSALCRFKHGVAGLYIGRAAMSNPYVFSEVLSGEQGTLRRDAMRTARIIERYIELLLEEFRPTQSIGKVKQLVSQMARGHVWRKPLLTAMTLEEQRTILRSVLDGSYPLKEPEKFGRDHTPVKPPEVYA